MKLKGVLCLSLALAVLLSVWAAAQEGADAEAPADQGEASAIDLQEGLFALMVVAVVMMGLIGFEYIHRRKRSL